METYDSSQKSAAYIVDDRLTFRSGDTEYVADYLIAPSGAMSRYDGQKYRCSWSRPRMEFWQLFASYIKNVPSRIFFYSEGQYKISLKIKQPLYCLVYHKTEFFSFSGCICIHDYVIKWKHFPRYLPFVRGIHRSPMNSPHKGQWRGALAFSLICARKNVWVNNREAVDLRRHGLHFDAL